MQQNSQKQNKVLRRHEHSSDFHGELHVQKIKERKKVNLKI